MKPLRFLEMGEGLMMVEFEMHNKIKVIHDGPLSFDKSLILVNDFEGS